MLQTFEKQRVGRLPPNHSFWEFTLEEIIVSVGGKKLA